MLGSQHSELSEQDTAVMFCMPGNEKQVYLGLLGVSVFVRRPCTLKEGGERDILLMHMRE